MATTILSSPLFVEIILPFLLVFTLVFAILQKTKVLGDGKKQVDAIVALVIGLIVVSFGAATGIILSLVPFLAVSAVVILIFLILYGMVYQKDFDPPNAVKITIGVLVAIAVIVAVLISTGAWNYLIDRFYSGTDTSNLTANIVFIVIILVAVGIVLLGGKEKKNKHKDDE